MFGISNRFYSKNSSSRMDKGMKSVEHLFNGPLIIKSEGLHLKRFIHHALCNRKPAMIFHAVELRQHIMPGYQDSPLPHDSF